MTAKRTTAKKTTAKPKLLADGNPHITKADGDLPVIAMEDPRAEDVRRLLARHLAFARAETPAEGVHALDLAALRDPAVTFLAARLAGELVGVGALKQLDAAHAELKSMHVVESARGRGIGRALVEALLAAARARGCERVSLETGVMAAFAPARALYASAGFVPCAPFGVYTGSPSSHCMTIALVSPRSADE